EKTSVLNRKRERYAIVLGPYNRLALDAEPFCQLTLGESGLFALVFEIDGNNFRAVHRKLSPPPGHNCDITRHVCQALLRHWVAFFVACVSTRADIGPN